MRVEACMTDQPATDSHSDAAEPERQRREAALDETIKQSFPASDPPSTDQIQTVTSRSHRMYEGPRHER